MKKIYLLLTAIVSLTTVAFSQINSTPAGGNWNSSGTWVGGIIPSSTDDVTIVSGAAVTINVDANAATLLVDGTLRYEAATARTLTVGSDVTVSTTGSFTSALTGTQNAHNLSLGGSLTNDGTLDFSTSANTAGANIFFTGASNETFGGAGAVTDVLTITVDKGTSAASVLELNPASFSFLGSTTTAGSNPGFLTLNNGTFKISGTFTMSNPVFNNIGGYTVDATTAIWLNNPNFTVAAQEGTADINGKLQVSAGTYNIGTGDGERLGYQTGSEVVITGGAVNLASRMSPSGTLGISYTQTGGTLTVNTVASGSGFRAGFDIPGGDGSSFTMSGGTIVIQNAGTGGGPQDYQNYADTKTITGGTLQFGNAASPESQTFLAQGWVPNLVIDNFAVGHTVRLQGNLEVFLNTTINPTTTLILDDGSTGYSFTQRGPTFTNAGTLTASFAGSDLLFSGTTPQTYNGDGVVSSPIATLEVFNGQGLSFANSIASEINVAQLIMNFGDVTTGVTTLAVGTSALAPGTFSYSFGTVIGKFKRYIPAATGTRNFPVGVPGITRSVLINFTTAPTAGGSLTTEWVNGAGGNNGLPLVQGSINVNNTSSQGYWSVVAGDGLTGGVYTGTFTGRSLATVTNYTTLVLVKRANSASPWILNGTHVTTTGDNAVPVLSRTGMTGFSEFAVGGDKAVNNLPITIEYFSGKKQANTSLLTWKVTCANAPSASFVLERSTDARNFVPINSLTATALRCLQEFNYTDATQGAGTNYYRLKVADPEGKVTYSQVIALLNKTKGFEILSLMPNVISATTKLNVSSATASKMELLVTDMNGKQVSRQTISLAAGSNQVPLNFAALSAGTYQLTGFTEDGQSKTIRFIKQ